MSPSIPIPSTYHGQVVQKYCSASILHLSIHGVLAAHNVCYPMTTKYYLFTCHTTQRKTVNLKLTSHLKLAVNIPGTRQEGTHEASISYCTSTKTIIHSKCLHFLLFCVYGKSGVSYISNIIVYNDCIMPVTSQQISKVSPSISFLHTASHIRLVT